MRDGPAELNQLKWLASELCLRPALDTAHPETEGLSCPKEGGSESLHPLSGLASGVSGLEAGAETFPAEMEVNHRELSTELELKSQKLLKEDQRWLS